MRYLTLFGILLFCQNLISTGFIFLLKNTAESSLIQLNGGFFIVVFEEFMQALTFFLIHLKF